MLFEQGQQIPFDALGAFRLDAQGHFGGVPLPGERFDGRFQGDAGDRSLQARGGDRGAIAVPKGQDPCGGEAQPGKVPIPFQTRTERQVGGLAFDFQSQGRFGLVVAALPEQQLRVALGQRFEQGRFEGRLPRFQFGRPLQLQLGGQAQRDAQRGLLGLHLAAQELGRVFPARSFEHKQIRLGEVHFARIHQRATLFDQTFQTLQVAFAKFRLGLQGRPTQPTRPDLGPALPGR